MSPSYLPYRNKFETLLCYLAVSIDSDSKALLQLNVVHVCRRPNRLIGVDARCYGGQLGPHRIACVPSERYAHPLLVVHQTSREARPRDDLVHALCRLTRVPDLAAGDAGRMKPVDDGMTLLGRRIRAGCVPRIRGVADGLGRPEEVGPEVARRDDVHVHAERRDLPRERLGKRVERGLGAVVRPERRHAREARRGADVQDVAGALRAEGREQRLGERDGPEHVRLELRVDVLGPACTPRPSPTRPTVFKNSKFLSDKKQERHEKTHRNSSTKPWRPYPALLTRTSIRP